MQILKMTQYHEERMVRECFINVKIEFIMYFMFL